MLKKVRPAGGAGRPRKNVTGNFDVRRSKLNRPGVQDRRGIPRPDAADGVAVYDGRHIVGICVEHDGSHFSFGNDGVLIGEYATRLQAARSLPRARP